MRLGRYCGEVLIATSLLHALVGVLAFSRPLVAIGRGRFVNAVEPHLERQLAFWFLTSGVLIFALGQLTRWAQRRTGALPASLGWTLLALAVAGVILMPVSGFWLVLPQAVLVLAASRQAGVAGVVSGSTGGSGDHDAREPALGGARDQRG